VAARAGIPIVAIVGRPNVGKSTLFNRIVGQRAAIVEDKARTTRDRLYGETDWNARRFMVVDTGGLEVDTSDPIEARVQDQARIAIAEADVIVFVVEAISGLTPADQEAAEVLRRAKAPVLLAVNKSDNAKRELEAAEFYALGWEHTYPIAAIHGRGVADLLDEVVLALPPESEAELARKRREDEAEAFSREVEAGRLEAYVVGDDEDEDGAGSDGAGEDDTAFDEATEEVVDEAAKRWDALIASESGNEAPAVAFVGRPNVGKSSLLNALLKQDRMIVSDIPGTTRDAIDTTIPWGRTEIVLIDTAGIRRRGRVAGGPAAEKYSTLRSFRAISRADVAVLLVDAVDGLTAQDAHIAGFVVEEGRGLVVAVNKWDAVDAYQREMADRALAQRLAFLRYASVLHISARKRQGLAPLWSAIIQAYDAARAKLPTPVLTRLLQEAVAHQAPKRAGAVRPKLRYAHQGGMNPPIVVIHGNALEHVTDAYKRYLEGRIRTHFGLVGTPLRIELRSSRNPFDRDADR
jgi:GTP-binding protein